MTNRYSVLVTDLALADLASIAAFYLDLVDEESAQRFEADADATINSLAAFPNDKPYFDQEHNLRRINLHDHKVSVIYTVKDNVYEVVAIAAFHALQDPQTYSTLIGERLNADS